MNTYPKIAFFGSPNIAVWVLDELKKKNIIPALVVTNPDSPQGRKMILTETPVSEWAKKHTIETLKPITLKDDEIYNTLTQSGCELFIVAAYGKIIPEAILNIPKFKTLNMHPSLLPKLRGASPIRSAILNDINPTGISIMILTPGMDEGPVLVQKEIAFSDDEWPLHGSKLDEILAKTGGEILADTIPSWIDGNITPQEQDHSSATYSTKITKEMGHLDLADDAYQNLLKIRAFDGWPGTFFFTERNGKTIRVKIVDAKLAYDNTLMITRVVPEGKNEMDYQDFLKSVL